MHDGICLPERAQYRALTEKIPQGVAWNGASQNMSGYYDISIHFAKSASGMAEMRIGQIAALADQAIRRINGHAGQQQCRNLRTKRSGDRIRYWIGKEWWAPQDSNL